MRKRGGGGGERERRGGGEKGWEGGGKGGREGGERSASLRETECVGDREDRLLVWWKAAGMIPDQSFPRVPQQTHLLHPNLSYDPITTPSFSPSLCPAWFVCVPLCLSIIISSTFLC